MERIARAIPSPAIVVSALALVAALAGTAVAGDHVASTSLSKKKTKKLAKRIATKRINKLAPSLSVATAEQANAANSALEATNAENAQHAENAQSARNADNAANASDANLLDGLDSGELTQIGGVFDAACDPEPGLGFVDCDPAPLGATSRTADVLVTVTAEWYDAEAGGSSRAECRFVRNGGVISGLREIGTLSDVTDEDHKLTLAMSHIDFDRPPGPHSYSLSCQESDANVVLHNVHTVARTLGG